MNDLVNVLNQNSGQLASLYIISGNNKKNTEEVFIFLQKKYNIKKNSSELFYFSGVDLKVDQVRKIKEINTTGNGKIKELRVFILDFQYISRISQNALLKTFEEPVDNTVFFLLVNSVNLLLDTIKSRAQIIKIISQEKDEIGRVFLKSKYKDRTKIIKKLNQAEYLQFIESLENALVMQREKIRNFPRVFKDFIEIKKKLSHKNVGFYYIFEFLAISLPIL